MRILAIETSCDETAIAVVEARGTEKDARFRVLGNALLSQIDIHREYGGVFPALAKRAHAQNLVPILEAALEEAELLHEDTQAVPKEVHDAATQILEREPGLDEQFLEFISETEPPQIDAIAVTAGPGLEPALWVGINFAKALSLAWRKPLLAVNHMEGHLFAGLAKREGEELVLRRTEFPVLALLISGGHTELVLMKEWLAYKLLGQTKDDAVGEAFDKVARMLGLPYPGGPEISRLAEAAREAGGENPYALPRPMLDAPNCDFSFAGLKTAVLYLLKNKELDDDGKRYVAEEFEDAAAEVLVKKTLRALEESAAKTLVIGGGVSANTHIRRVFREKLDAAHPDVALCIPDSALTTDNAVMISLAAYLHALKDEYAKPEELRANGNLALA